MFPELTASLGPIYFWLFAAVAVACGVNLLLSRHPLMGAMSLIGVMLSLAGLYAILQSPFVAVLQVLVYAGAIMMLLVFVVMILNQGKDHAVPRTDKSALLGIAVPLALCAVVVRELKGAALVESPKAVRAGIDEVATQLFQAGAQLDTAAVGQGWWLLFEVGGLVLLAAVVGAVLLSKRSLDTPAEAVRLADDEVETEGDAHASHGAKAGAH